MSSNEKSQHTATRVAAINTQISKLAEPIAMLSEEHGALEERTAVLAEGITLRDWVISGHRPKNCSELPSEVKKIRSHLYAKRLADVAPPNQTVRPLKSDYSNVMLTPACLAWLRVPGRQTDWF